MAKKKINKDIDWQRSPDINKGAIELPLELIWVLLGVMWIVDVIEFGSGGGLKLGCVSVVLVSLVGRWKYRSIWYQVPMK